MKQWKNQSGLTLIELLGALTLTFIVGIGIFSTLTHSLDLFDRESTRIDVRGQANIIANQLTTFYQENNDFRIENHEGSVTITSGLEERTFSLINHQIEVSAKADEVQNGFVRRAVEITISGEGESFTLNTMVSRLWEESNETSETD